MLCPPLLCRGGRARHTHFILAFLLFLLQWAEALHGWCKRGEVMYPSGLWSGTTISSCYDHRQCERKVYLWCMQCEGCGFCLTTVECPMRGRIPPDEDAWLYRKWKTEVDVDSLLQATLPPGPIEDEVHSYEAFVTVSRVSELSNAATPEHYVVVPVLATPSNVAKPSDAGISEEEDAAISVASAWMATRRTPIDETKPLVVGDWLSDKDILAWLNDKLYHNEVEEPRAWSMAVTYIVSCLKMMRKYEDSKGNNHTTIGLAWRRRHIFIVNSDDREGLHGFLCAIDCTVTVWAFKVHTWHFVVILWSGQC